MDNLSDQPHDILGFSQIHLAFLVSELLTDKNY